MQGTEILHALTANPSISAIRTLTRRALPATSSSPKLQPHVDADTGTWAAQVSSNATSILFSALATTRGAAGSFSAQYALEHDLNVTLARVAKESGRTKVYVLISAAGADPGSSFAYPRMKGEMERDVRALGFERTIILRPGLIAGRREERRLFEGVVRGVADGLGKLLGNWAKDPWAQDKEVIARAAVRAGLMAERGEVADPVWVIGGREIIKLGREEEEAR